MAEFQAKREQKEASSSKSSDNTGAMRPPPARVRRDVESLGWMTESTKMPKKQRVIDGVGAGSLVDLKAQLYRTQVGHSRLLLIFGGGVSATAISPQVFSSVCVWVRGKGGGRGIQHDGLHPKWSNPCAPLNGLEECLTYLRR